MQVATSSFLATSATSGCALSPLAPVIPNAILRVVAPPRTFADFLCGHWITFFTAIHWVNDNLSSPRRLTAALIAFAPFRPLTSHAIDWLWPVATGASAFPDLRHRVVANFTSILWVLDDLTTAGMLAATASGAAKAP